MLEGMIINVFSLSVLLSFVDILSTLRNCIHGRTENKEDKFIFSRLRNSVRGCFYHSLNNLLAYEGVSLVLPLSSLYI